MGDHLGSHHKQADTTRKPQVKSSFPFPGQAILGLPHFCPPHHAKSDPCCHFGVAHRFLFQPKPIGGLPWGRIKRPSGVKEHFVTKMPPICLARSLAGSLKNGQPQNGRGFLCPFKTIEGSAMLRNPPFPPEICMHRPLASRGACGKYIEMPTSNMRLHGSLLAQTFQGPEAQALTMPPKRRQRNNKHTGHVKMAMSM